MMKKIGIFCGAKNGNSEKIKSETAQLVSLFAKSNFDLVYGGSSKGLMGTVAKIFRENNRQVIGVLPYKKLKAEKPSQLLSQSIYVDNLFE